MLSSFNLLGNSRAASPLAPVATSADPDGVLALFHFFFFYLTQMMCFSLSEKKKKKTLFSLFHVLALISSIFCHGLPCSPDQTITKRLLHQVEHRRSRLEIRCAVQSGPGDTVQTSTMRKHLLVGHLQQQFPDKIWSAFSVSVCCDSPLTSFSFLNQRRSAAGLLPWVMQVRVMWSPSMAGLVGPSISGIAGTPDGRR